ncbi:MAG: phosphatase PAP2 family protein [Lewinellaceae bacterium]|nr:phosphatase PAP2 family protein [Lewinella sp.]MCB9278322.1 phosphatase PAP2 family protein [Lewinellaceae bacterium]
MDLLLHWDEQLFRLINGQWHTGWLDAVMPLWREKLFWVPFYLALTAWSVWRYKWRGLVLILFMGAAVAVSDPVSSQLFKKNVERLRPCRTPGLEESVHLLVPCGGGYSFTSSHATNHFALAFFLIGTLGRRYRRWRWPLALWAASIAYGQVYVGVHFPLDVICGALLGAGIGALVAYFYRKWDKVSILNEQ